MLAIEPNKSKSSFCSALKKIGSFDDTWKATPDIVKKNENAVVNSPQYRTWFLVEFVSLPRTFDKRGGYQVPRDTAGQFSKGDNKNGKTLEVPRLSSFSIFIYSFAWLF